MRKKDKCIASVWKLTAQLFQCAALGARAGTMSKQNRDYEMFFFFFFFNSNLFGDVFLGEAFIYIEWP